MDAECRLVFGETAGERAKPVVTRSPRHGETQQIRPRRRAHGGEVRQIDPEQLARDQGGGIVGQEMDAGDQHVLGDDQPAALADAH